MYIFDFDPFLYIDITKYGTMIQALTNKSRLYEKTNGCMNSQVVFCNKRVRMQK
jgi:hypothetical protein